MKTIDLVKAAKALQEQGYENRIYANGQYLKVRAGLVEWLICEDGRMSLETPKYVDFDEITESHKAITALIKGAFVEPVK